MKASSVMRRGTGRYFHWCPACEELHPLPDSWTFDGNLEKPTFSPSFKHTGLRAVNKNGKWTGEYHRGPDGKPLDWVCHYFITGGFIQFCCDSSHGRSDIVQMPDLPPYEFSIETQD